MLDDVIQNRQHILLFIQYEVLQKKEVFEAYKSFCKILGENVMEYSEFDFWFYYFVNGVFNLDYERKMDPKPLELSDLPIEVVYKVVEKLEWKEKFIFRNVSKQCRKLVDKTPATINEIDLSDSPRGTILTLDSHSFKYGNHKEDDWVESDEEGTEYDEEDEEESDSDEELLEAEEREKCEKRVVQKLAIVLNNPKVQIVRHYFSIKEHTLVDKLNDLFKSLSHQVHVESFKYEDYQRKNSKEINFMKFLPHFKPGVLENIIVFNCKLTVRELASNIEKLAELEQWNQAKQFRTDYEISDNFDKVAHFDCLRVHLDGNFKYEHVVYLKNVYLKSPTFKRCDLCADEWDTERIREELGGDRFPMTDGSTLHVDIFKYCVYFTRK